MPEFSIKIIYTDLVTALQSNDSFVFHPEVDTGVLEAELEHLLKNGFDLSGRICLLLQRCDTQEILAYRYFICKPDVSDCALFAVFVADPYRRQGFSKLLIQESIQHALSLGASHFTVYMAREEPERDGLYHYYEQLASDLPDHCKLTVFYRGRENILK